MRPGAIDASSSPRGRELLERSIQNANIAFHWRGARVEITAAGRRALAADKCEQFRPRALPGEPTTVWECVQAVVRDIAESDATGAK